MNRAEPTAAAQVVAAVKASATPKQTKKRRILLRSSWQTVNIGDIAHTPGMLALLEKHLPGDEVILWPNPLSAEVERLLTVRFPRLCIARTEDEQAAALAECDLCVHGSAPGLVGKHEVAQARAAGKPYGFAGVTLSDEELAAQRDLLAGARFVFTRDGDSLTALESAGLKGPKIGFGPDATFALDLRDDAAADRLLQEHDLEPGKYLCAIPRLRWTPYWEIHPERFPPNPERSAINEAFADRDHAKLREAIVAWVTQTGLRVLLTPEMTYEVPRLRPLLFDPLPAAVKPSVAVLDRYWLTAEAASVYARAAAVISFENHSAIMAVASGVPAILLRQPTDTRKGQMWRDIGLARWLFEIDSSSGREIAARLVEIGTDLPAARAQVAQARAFAHAKMADMIAEFDRCMA